MTPAVVRWLSRAGLIGGAALVLAGCPEDPSEIVDPAGEGTVWNFPVTSVYVEPEATGVIENLIVAQIDTSVEDAFDRDGDLELEEASFYSFGGEVGSPPDWEADFLNGSEDTRLPALQDDDAAGPVSMILQSVFDEQFVVCNLTGLAPNTQYTWGVERLALNINEGLDHSNVLLDNPAYAGIVPVTNPDAPDELVRLGGSPGTTLGSNPIELEGFVTDANGATGLAVCTESFAGSDDLFDTNTLDGFDLPQYNYLVLYEGTSTAGTPVMRAQFGVDLLPSGEPVNNAFGSFPTEAIDKNDFLAAPGAAGRPDSISVLFSDLEELASGEYQAWLINPATGQSMPAVGTYNRIKVIPELDPVTGDVISTRDSIVETVPNVASFVGDDSEAGFRHQLIVTDATLPGGPEDTVGFYTNLFLTISESATLANIPDSRPYWWTYTDQNETPENFFDDSFEPDEDDVKFGNFNLTDPALSRRFSGAGQGTGNFRADELVVEMTRLSRPPVGYMFVGWLILEDGSAVRLPDPTTPPPARLNLTNADVEPIGDVVTSTGILAANVRAFEGDIGINFGNARTFALTLEPKLGVAAMGAIVVHVGAVPVDVIETAPAE